MKSMAMAFLLLAGIASVSCAGDSRQANRNLPKPVQPLAFENTIYEKKDGACTGDTTPCITIQIQYPTAIAGTDAARHAVNDVITTYVLSALAGHVADSAKHSGSIDSLSAELFSEYRAFTQEVSENSGFITPWEITISGKVVYKEAAVATVEIGTYSYMGGAHPNYWTTYKNFDPLTGKLLLLQDISNDTLKLKALAEQEFRRSNKLGAREDLEKAGYWFGGNTFTLPSNYAFTDKGFVFVYNPYEIASYAQGPIEILLPYTRLKGLLKADYLP